MPCFGLTRLEIALTFKKKKVLATRYKEIGKEEEAAERVRALSAFLLNGVIAELECRSYMVRRHSYKEQQ